MRKNRDLGFSLVELIIVIAIMAVLVGVLAPVFVKYVESGKESVDIQNMDNAYEMAYAARCEAEYDTCMYYYASTADLGTEVPTETYGKGKSVNGGKTFAKRCCDEGGYDPSQSYAGKYIQIILPEATSDDLTIHVHWVE